MYKRRCNRGNWPVKRFKASAEREERLPRRAKQAIQLEEGKGNSARMLAMGELNYSVTGRHARNPGWNSQQTLRFRNRKKKDDHVRVTAHQSPCTKQSRFREPENLPIPPNNYEHQHLFIYFTFVHETCLFLYKRKNDFIIAALHSSKRDASIF